MSSEPSRRAGALYCGEFEGFDPMTAEIDSEFAGELVRIARRARECLECRTNDQVRAIAELSDYWVSLDVLGGRITCQHADGTEEVITMETVGDVDERGLLKWVCGTLGGMIAETGEKRLDIKASGESGDGIEINRLTPSDLLAAHSLVQCVRLSDALAARSLVQHVRNRESNHVGSMTAEELMHIVIATECITLAELEIEHSRRLSETTKIVLRASGQFATDARWKKWEPAKARAMEIYKSKAWSSRAEAVREMKSEIMQLVEKTAGERLSDQNAEKTIDGWLRKSSS